MEVIQPLHRETNAVLLEYEVKSPATESRHVSRIVTCTQISVAVTRGSIFTTTFNYLLSVDNGAKATTGLLKSYPSLVTHTHTHTSTS
jgi:hypothetical protein